MVLPVPRASIFAFADVKDEALLLPLDLIMTLGREVLLESLTGR